MIHKTEGFLALVLWGVTSQNIWGRGWKAIDYKTMLVVTLPSKRDFLEV